MAPEGTVTVKEVAVAAVTVAFILPKNTIFNDGVVLKPLPFMVTDVPTLPETGVNELMEGTAKAKY